MTLSAMDEIKDTLRFLRETPIQILALTQGLSDREIRSRTPEGYFSVIENVCHLRDIEIEGYAARIARILNENEPHLPDIDGGRLAVERDYNNQDLDPALRAFVDAREQNLEIVKRVSEEQFERAGVLEGVGTVSLNKLLMMMREHDEGHIDELRSARSRLLTAESDLQV
ncbi:MAG: DinB family protein [Pyrinomonadaceae bacterium]